MNLFRVVNWSILAPELTCFEIVLRVLFAFVFVAIMVYLIYRTYVYVRNQYNKCVEKNEQLARQKREKINIDDLFFFDYDGELKYYK